MCFLIGLRGFEMRGDWLRRCLSLDITVLFAEGDRHLRSQSLARLAGEVSDDVGGDRGDGVVDQD